MLSLGPLSRCASELGSVGLVTHCLWPLFRALCVSPLLLDALGSILLQFSSNSFAILTQFWRNSTAILCSAKTQSHHKTHSRTDDDLCGCSQLGIIWQHEKCQNAKLRSTFPKDCHSLGSLLTWLASDRHTLASVSLSRTARVMVCKVTQRLFSGRLRASITRTEMGAQVTGRGETDGQQESIQRATLVRVLLENAECACAHQTRTSAPLDSATNLQHAA